MKQNDQSSEWQDAIPEFIREGRSEADQALRSWAILYVIDFGRLKGETIVDRAMKAGVSPNLLQAYVNRFRREFFGPATRRVHGIERVTEMLAAKAPKNLAAN